VQLSSRGGGRKVYSKHSFIGHRAGLGFPNTHSGKEDTGSNVAWNQNLSWAQPRHLLWKETGSGNLKPLNQSWGSQLVLPLKPTQARGSGHSQSAWRKKMHPAWQPPISWVHLWQASHKYSGNRLSLFPQVPFEGFIRFLIIKLIQCPL
jgi:hypothetical protein